MTIQSQAAHPPPVIALSFTEFITRYIQAQGRYWEAADFAAYGDVTEYVSP